MVRQSKSVNLGQIFGSFLAVGLGSVLFSACDLAHFLDGSEEPPLPRSEPLIPDPVDGRVTGDSYQRLCAWLEKSVALGQRNGLESRSEGSFSPERFFWPVVSRWAGLPRSRNGQLSQSFTASGSCSDLDEHLTFHYRSSRLKWVDYSHQAERRNYKLRVSRDSIESEIRYEQDLTEPAGRGQSFRLDATAWAEDGFEVEQASFGHLLLRFQMYGQQVRDHARGDEQRAALHFELLLELKYDGDRSLWYVSAAHSWIGSSDSGHYYDFPK